MFSVQTCKTHYEYGNTERPRAFSGTHIKTEALITVSDVAPTGRIDQNTALYEFPLTKRQTPVATQKVGHGSHMWRGTGPA
jgi:hypothetical protein